MEEILEQINNLTEQFSNLFEVEGLGQPASDVPPSTNKIKKDRKTKDGKVEIVSVEDELFPYDGNKREQFRQKIIDKINDMIQGTATLEDLLQLVRSKQVKPVKEGFEGAIELLEDILGDINRSNKSEKEKDKLYDKIRTARGKELVQSDLYRKRDPRFKSSSSEIRYSSKKDNDDDRTNKKREEDKKLEFSKGGRPIYTRNGKLVDFAEGFEGAIELAEDLYNYIKKKHGEPKYAGIDSHPANKSAGLIHKMSDAKGKEYAEEKGKNPDVNLYNKRHTTKNTRGEQKTQNRSSAYRKFSDDWRLPKTDDEKIKGSIKRNAEKNIKHLDSKIKKASNEFNELYLKKQSDPNINLHPAAHKEGNLRIERDKQKARLASLKESIQQLSELFDRPSLEDDVLKTTTGKGTKQHLQDLGKKLLGLDKKKVKKEKTCESFDSLEENNYNIIRLLEEVINEVSDKTAQGALDKAKERYNRKGYEASMKLFQGDSKGAIEDGNKAQDEYNKHINMQLRRAKRQGKKLVQDKNDHDSFKIE